MRRWRRGCDPAPWRSSWGRTTWSAPMAPSPRWCAPGSRRAWCCGARPARETQRTPDFVIPARGLADTPSAVGDRANLPPGSSAQGGGSDGAHQEPHGHDRRNSRIGGPHAARNEHSFIHAPQRHRLPSTEDVACESCRGEDDLEARKHGREDATADQAHQSQSREESRRASAFHGWSITRCLKRSP